MNQMEGGAIIAETKAFADAMNAGDAALAASFYTEDGTRVGAFGDVFSAASRRRKLNTEVTHMPLREGPQD